MKLLRPLHRQRQRRRTTAQVMNAEELCAYLNVTIDALEPALQNKKIAYYKDSQGSIWASIALPPPQL